MEEHVTLYTQVGCEKHHYFPDEIDELNKEVQYYIKQDIHFKIGLKIW